MKKTKLVKNQKLLFEKVIGNEKIKVKISHNDDCNSGHNTFHITADLSVRTTNGWKEDSWGCLHDEIVKFFPEFEPLIKWHGCHTEAPIYYLLNTLYNANDKDCWGFRKGEPSRFETTIKWDNFPITIKLSTAFTGFLEGLDFNYDLEMFAFPHTDREGRKFDPKWTLLPFANKWHECPFETELECSEFLEALQNHPHKFVKITTGWGEGKEPDLEAARASAIWPDGTLEELQSKEILEARLPQLMQDFQEMVEGLGLVY